MQHKNKSHKTGFYLNRYHQSKKTTEHRTIIHVQI